MNVIGYIRVSTEGQCKDDKFGMEAQEQSIMAYAEAHDMKIIRWVRDEGESGAKERPGFDSLVYGDDPVSLHNPLPYEAVIVAKSDRVARDINIYYYYKMLLRKKSIRLISIAEDFGQFGVFSSMLEAFTLCVAEMERENINKRTSGGRKLKAKAGGYAGGRAPMGYSIQNGTLTINPQEAPTVRTIFALREKNFTLQEITNALNSTSALYRTRSGKPFSVSTVQSILNNRKTYEGYYHYGPSSTEWVKGQHSAILSPSPEVATC